MTTESTAAIDRLAIYEDMDVDPETGLRVLHYEVDRHDRGEYFPTLPEGWGCLRGSFRYEGPSEYDRKAVCWSALVGPLGRLRAVIERRLRLSESERWEVSPLYVEILPCAVDADIIHAQGVA